MRNKVASSDFNDNNLPKNRWELFLDIIKNQYRVLLKIGLLLLIFSIPLLLIGVFGDFAKIELVNSKEISTEELKTTLSVLNQIIFAISLLGLAILSIGIAGIIKILKRLCFLEPVFFVDDFKLGVKDSVKTSLLIFILSWFLFLISYFPLAFSDLNILSILPIFVCFIAIYPTFFVMIFATTIYNLGFVKLFKTFFLIYCKSLFKTLGIYLLFSLPLLVLLIPNVFIKMIILLTLIIFISPITFTGAFCYNLTLFDNFINRKFYPEIYRKGLSSQKD